MGARLPLTTMEEFLLFEDRRAFPWSCYYRLRFAGTLQQQALINAVELVLPRHMLLRSKVELQGKCHRWVEVHDAMPELVWLRQEPDDSFLPAKHLDVRQSIGLRLLVIIGDGRSDLILQWHHACCDGLGMSGFIRDLLLAYAAETNTTGHPPRLPRLNPELLRDRGGIESSGSNKLVGLRRQFMSLKRALRFYCHHPVPLVPHRPRPDDASPPENYPATCHRLLSRPETDALRCWAQNEGATLNELLIRELFLAMDRLRRDRGHDDGREWMRMMVPISLRRPGDRRLPAANVVSSVFLDRRGKDVINPRKLLTGIRKEMKRIADNQLQWTFPRTLSVLRRLPGGIAGSVRRHRCSMTCIFTNVGELFRRLPLPKSDSRYVVGNVLFESIDGLAPIRPCNCLTLATVAYAGRRTINLHYDPQILSAELASQFWDAYLSRVLTLAGDPAKAASQMP